MTSKKDMRRADLVIPYVDPPKEKSETDMGGAMSTTLPMAAMFTRNRLIGWVSVVISVQNWLAESPEQAKNAATPSYMNVFMSLMAMGVTYMPLFFPPPPGRGSTTAAAPSPSPSP
ncbi:hypothetical protein BGW36DRAFT_423423 [Talaromyces proteolyticus]|uniref:Protein Asterix n=1 Tax=Talaromyces proteolyticus TaxID=1131652 RepID=A0AAD4Q0A2_9EURO|nr:uncharacterized protein BGW36DRAFT_423423 [Talaromyces proteolyticus]KAH8703878.1 hypothetical protein BGW36DRAFT_423423 [Talaromyces proteolyticus]